MPPARRPALRTLAQSWLAGELDAAVERVEAAETGTGAHRSALQRSSYHKGTVVKADVQRLRETGARSIAPSGDARQLRFPTSGRRLARRAHDAEPPRLRSRREAATASAKPMAAQTATKPRHWAPQPPRIAHGLPDPACY